MATLPANGSKRCKSCGQEAIDRAIQHERDYCDNCIQNISKHEQIFRSYSRDYTRSDHAKSRQYFQAWEERARSRNRPSIQREDSRQPQAFGQSWPVAPTGLPQQEMSSQPQIATRRAQRSGSMLLANYSRPIQYSPLIPSDLEMQGTISSNNNNTWTTPRGPETEPKASWHSGTIGGARLPPNFTPGFPAPQGCYGCPLKLVDDGRYIRGRDYYCPSCLVTKGEDHEMGYSG